MINGKEQKIHGCIAAGNGGLSLLGRSILRGWHREMTYEYEDPDSVGNNCVRENRLNVWGAGACSFFFAEIYPDQSLIPHYRGGYNDIVNPTDHQGDMLNGAYGALYMNYWNGDHSVIPGGSPLGKYLWDPEVQTSVGCASGAPQTASYSSDPRVALMARLLNIEFDPEKGYVPQLREALRARRTHSTTGVTLQAGTPDGYLLSPAFPNPFRTTTEVRFFVPRTEAVSLRVYDAMGREAAVLFDDIAQTGFHQAIFTAAHLPSGLYIATMRTASRTLSSTILLTR